MSVTFPHPLVYGEWRIHPLPSYSNYSSQRKKQTLLNQDSTFLMDSESPNQKNTSRFPLTNTNDSKTETPSQQLSQNRQLSEQPLSYSIGKQQEISANNSRTVGQPAPSRTPAPQTFSGSSRREFKKAPLPTTTNSLQHLVTLCSQPATHQLASSRSTNTSQQKQPSKPRPSLETLVTPFLTARNSKTSKHHWTPRTKSNESSTAPNFPAHPSAITTKGTLAPGDQKVEADLSPIAEADEEAEAEAVAATNNDLREHQPLAGPDLTHMAPGAPTQQQQGARDTFNRPQIGILQSPSSSQPTPGIPAGQPSRRRSAPPEVASARSTSGETGSSASTSRTATSTSK